MSWIPLQTTGQIAEIKEKSHSRPQLIFKHSTRCSVSSMALNRLEKAGLPADLDHYLLDLIACREVSNLVASAFDVWHESPQVLVIKNGECVYDESHMAINLPEILSAAGAHADT